jgi:hypothetical protein
MLGLSNISNRRTEQAMEEKEQKPADGDAVPFRIRDCALIPLATGLKAQNLKELRNLLLEADAGCIYYAFWGGLLKPGFENPEYANDFASWAHAALHDDVLAERLGVIDPTEFDDLESLRRELVDVIEEHLDGIEVIAWTRRDQQFNFITSQIVVFDAQRELTEPRELAEVVREMSSSSIFYHFIDARRRTDKSMGDFRAWLGGFGDRYQDLRQQLAEVDPYFSTLVELRHRLASLFEGYFTGDRH